MPARSSPDKFLTRVRKPTDFDEYWNDVLLQASAVPMEAEVNLDELRSSEDICLLYTSPSPRDGLLSRMPSSA